MKRLKIIRVVPMLIFLIPTILGSCKKDSGVDPQTQRINDLSATWQVASIINDGVDVTAQFAGFSLTIDALTYTTQNGGNTWPSSGSYDFLDGTLDKFLRNDGVEIAIDEIKTNSLTLSFQMANLSGGRQAGITGDFTFTLSK